MGFATSLFGVSPGGATKSVTGFPSMSTFPSMGAMPTASGMLVSQATSLQVSTVYACVRIRSRDLARCTPQILRDDRQGNKTQILDHPLSAIFKKPNRAQTWFEFLEQQHIAYLLRSNAYAVILRDWRGNPTELIPVNPDLVTPMEAPDGSIFYTTARAGMWLAACLQNEPISIPAADMLHVRDLSFNSLVGVSRIAFARDAVGLAMVQEQQASRWAGNGARPAGVLESAKTLSPDAAARLKAQWEGMQAGIQNTGKTAVLEDGMTFKPLSLTSVDLEFIQARLVQVKEIARFFEIPLHKLGENESLPRASVDQLNSDYVQNVVMSDATRWEQKIAATFALDALGLEVKFDERGLLRADLATMMTSARTGVMSGLITQNEGRAYIGYGPMSDADKLLAPVNLAPNGSAMDGKAPDGAGRPPAGELPGGAKAIVEAVTKAVLTALKYNPDQPRDAHGRWGSGGSSDGSSDETGGGTAPSDAALVTHNVKLLVGGIALVAAGALAVALAPEAGAAAAAAGGAAALADLVANGMFTEAGTSSAKAILKEMGVSQQTTDHALQLLSSLTAKSQTPVDPQRDKTMTILVGKLTHVAELARDALVAELTSAHPDAPNLAVVTDAIGASCQAYQAALAKLV